MWLISVIYIILGIRFEELDWNKEKIWEGTDQITRKSNFLLKLYANIADQIARKLKFLLKLYANMTNQITSFFDFLLIPDK